MLNPLGHLVEFIDKGRIFLGLVTDFKKNRLKLLTAHDREMALATGRALLYTKADGMAQGNRAAQTAFLRERQEARQALAAQVDVAELWELVHEEETPLPLVDLAELVFGKPVSGDQQSAVLRALFDERLHFRLAGDQYVPLAADKLEQKVIQQQREAEKADFIDNAVSWLKEHKNGGDPETAPPGLIDLLVDLAVFEEDAAEAKQAKQIVSLAELGGNWQLFKVLVKLGVFGPNENLPLRKERLAKAFPVEVVDQANDLKPAGNLPGREDLSGLYTITIDGFHTSDFDDALSFEPDGEGGGELGVHITDAAAMIEPGTPLDEESQARASSIYLPDDRIPMMPAVLSEELLSLRQGEPRPAVSTFARVDKNGEVTGFRVALSMLKVDRRLTYEEADGLLASDQRLAGMRQVCLALKEKRRQAGAYFLPLPEVLIWVDDEGRVNTRRVDRDGESREMVAETAIVANWLMARFLEENQIPSLYRTQPPPKKPFEEGDPRDIFLHFSQRRLLNRVDICATPGLHSSLGVSPYVHATSPIRRYLDLVMQRQLSAALTGQTPPYSQEDLDQIAMHTMPGLRAGNRVRQARQRYWLLKWLEERKGQVLPGLVTEDQMRRWQLLLTDIMLLTSVPQLPELKLAPGQEIGIRIDKVSAFNDVLRVSVAG